MRVDRRGIEPRLPGCKPSVFPLDQRPFREVRPGIEPGPRPYQGRVLPEHLQTIVSVIPGGVEPPISWRSTRRLGRWTTGSFHVSDRGGSRTHKITRLSTWSLYQGLRTRPRSSSGSGSRTPAVQAYEARMSTGPPASSIQLQVPVTIRAHRPHEGWLGACPPAVISSSSQGES